jgi:hypothetical protein
MNEEGMLKPALQGGVALGILSAFPFIGLLNCACCAWIWGGSLLAAYLYVKNSSIPVTLGRGMTLGLLTGIIGACVTFLFTIPIYMIRNKSGIGFAEEIRQTLNQIPNLPPESRELARSLSEGGGLLLGFIAAALLAVLMIYCILTMLGGMIGVALFEKRPIGAPREDAMSYTPPIDLPPSPPPDVE